MDSVTQYVVVGGVIILAIAFIVWRTIKMWRNARRDGNCAGCPLADKCAKEHCDVQSGNCCH